MTKRAITMKQIKFVVARHMLIPVKTMDISLRARRVAYPRHIAMYFCRELTGKSYLLIGRTFGGRDHKTVIHAVRNVEHLIEGDNEWSRAVAAIAEQLGRLSDQSASENSHVRH